MAQKDNPFLMDAEFQCAKCNSVIGIRVQLAIVKSTGIEVACEHCEARYLVTEAGAIPTDKHISGTVHSGYFAWDESITKEPLMEETTE
jgi:hypothetical protein